MSSVLLKSLPASIQEAHVSVQGQSLTNFALCMQTKVGVIAFCLTFVQTVFAQLAATNLSNTRYNYTVASWLAGTAF